MKRFFIIVGILIPPIGLIYLFAAINFALGYRKLYCGAGQPTFREQMIAKIEDKGIPVPLWLKKPAKSC